MGKETVNGRCKKIRRVRCVGFDEVKPRHASKRYDRVALISWVRRAWNERVLDASRKRIDEYKDKEVPIEQGGKRTIGDDARANLFSVE